MPLYCSTSSLAPKISRIFGSRRKENGFPNRHVEPARFFNLNYKIPQSFPTHIGFVSKLDQACSYHVMEEDQRKMGIFPETEEYSKELDAAVRAVQMACSLRQKVQENLISEVKKSSNQVQSKDDNSPVTVACNGLECPSNCQLDIVQVFRK